MGRNFQEYETEIKNQILYLVITHLPALVIINFLFPHGDQQPDLQNVVIISDQSDCARLWLHHGDYHNLWFAGKNRGCDVKVLYVG